MLSFILEIERLDRNSYILEKVYFILFETLSIVFFIPFSFKSVKNYTTLSLISMAFCTTLFAKFYILFLIYSINYFVDSINEVLWCLLILFSSIF